MKTTLEEVSTDRRHQVMGIASLVLLTIYSSGSSILTATARRSQGGTTYSATLAVLLGELLKLVVSLALATRTQSAVALEGSPLLEEKAAGGGLWGGTGSASRPRPYFGSSWLDRYVSSTLDSLRDVVSQVFRATPGVMGIPALLFTLQNVCALWGASYVTPLTFQSLHQLKLLFAALLTGAVLKRSLTRTQWISLVALVGGIFALSAATAKQGNALRTSAIHRKVGPWSVTHEVALHQTTGVLAVVASAFLGSLGSICMERSFKASDGVSMWARNAQLALFCSLISLVALVRQQLSDPASLPLFHRFGLLAWSTVVVRALGGLLVAMVVRYADTIQKGFATSLAIVLTLAVESVVNQRPPAPLVCLGALGVVGSTIAYTYGRRRPAM